LFGFFERYAFKDHALQPNPESLGAAQLLEAKTDTALGASWLHSGQDAVSSCFLESFSNVFLHASQWYSNRGIIHLAELLIGNICGIYDLIKVKMWGVLQVRWH
jgi:hypothetical protein